MCHACNKGNAESCVLQLHLRLRLQVMGKSHTAVCRGSRSHTTSTRTAMVLSTCG